jgi:hypothetical protein
MALRNQPYLPLYVNDFMNDEKLKPCSAESIGVYIRLMCLLHKCEEYGSITFDALDERTSDICYDFATKLLPHLLYKHDVIIRGLHELITRKVLTLDGECLYQKRMLRDGKLSEIRAASGSAGGTAKAEKSSITHSKHCSKILANSDIVTDTDTDTDAVSKSTLDESRFTEFWNLYPKKIGKKAAYASWRRIKVTAELHDKMLAAIRLQKTGAQWQKDNGQYIPNPATWLNQGRWDDEVQPAQRDQRPRDSKAHYNPFLDSLREDGVIE